MHLSRSRISLGMLNGNASGFSVVDKKGSCRVAFIIHNLCEITHSYILAIFEQNKHSFIYTHRIFTFILPSFLRRKKRKTGADIDFDLLCTSILAADSIFSLFMLCDL